MTNIPCKEIAAFFRSEKYSTICCLDDSGAPYCFNCMYLFNANDGLIYYKSSPHARHSLYLDKDSRISGTILPVKPDLLALKGAQFSGELLKDNDPLCINAKIKYHFAFPLAVSMPGKVYVLKLNGIKLTDNSVKFGKKFIWERSDLLTTIPV